MLVEFVSKYAKAISAGVATLVALHVVDPAVLTDVYEAAAALVAAIAVGFSPANAE